MLYKKRKMNRLSKIGKRKTIAISISILLVSIYTIFLYHYVRPEIELRKLIQQIIRFVLTLGLLLMVYKGKKWAKIIAIILFSLAVLGSLFALIILNSSFISKIPLLVTIFIYSVAIYHFGFSKSFKAFIKSQNTTPQNTKEIEESEEV